jgi:neurogenin 1/neurogenin 2
MFGLSMKQSRMSFEIYIYNTYIIYRIRYYFSQSSFDLEIQLADSKMNTSCTKSCDWISGLAPGAVIAYTPLENEPQRNQQPRIMESNFCSSAEISTESYSGSRFCAPADDIGLLNIPSIYETMNTSCYDEPTKPLEWNWPPDETQRAGKEEVKCDADDEDEHSTNSTEAVPREPLKRLRRQRANDRERRRMKSLNGALNNLKRCIPLPKTKRRVTKLEILRIACNYIQSLWETLNNGSNEGNMEPLVARGVNPHHIVNGMSVTQRLNLLSNNLKFNFQL